MTAAAPATGGPPAVSVVIPTYNRAVLLADTLAALSRQVYPADRIEVVVVDNSSTDDTARVVQTAAAAAPFPIRYFRKDNRGPAAARNFGVARATGSVLAFTDSDCTMASDWVVCAVRRLGPQVSIVSGPVRPVVNPRRIPGFFYHQTDHSRQNDLYPTANVFYRRPVFDHLGGFKEEFGAYPWGSPIGGEDIDLAWRAKHAGYIAAWAEDAPVYHEASSMRAVTWLIEPIRSEIMPRLVAEIPELRRGLLWRCFVSREGMTFYLALAGAALALLRLPGAARRRRLAGLILAVPWLWLLHPMIDRDLWPPARWGRMPLKYALMAQRHGLTAATLIYASLRYRTLVL